MNKIFNLIGPSGSGKTTLGMGALRPMGLPEAISHTTRAMRFGEQEGDPYYFVSLDEFEKVEKIEETFYSGNHYCLSRHEVDEKLAAGSMYVITDINGSNALKAAYGDRLVTVFIDVLPHLIEERMKKRGDKPENIQARLKNAELNHEFDNGPLCDYIVNNSGAFEDGVSQLQEIVKKECSISE